MRRHVRPRWGLPLSLALVVALAACQPIVMKADGTVRSAAASRAVDPTTVRVGGRSLPGIDIRMRDCQQVLIERPDGDPIDLGLTPRATVVDARGIVLFDNNGFQWPDAPVVRPAGSYEVTADRSPDGAHHIVVPTPSYKAPLTISFICDQYLVGSHGLYPRWIFPTCRTNTRTCRATAPGTGEFRLNAG